MSEQTSREAVLSIPIGDVISSLKDALDLAGRCGDVCASVYYATRINALNDIVDGLVSVDKDTDGLIREQYAESNHQ